ncbi:MAG: hypothetical protein JRI23_16270 [Deltaproteobacteria bacterium]|jgi:hypothetical protein|nr:hypothetical protein [Deltaproteobacteria bacterium]MBW2533327.1 hypothetical protein [Deltaproteobacteria bacterium]
MVPLTRWRVGAAAVVLWATVSGCSSTTAPTAPLSPPAAKPAASALTEDEICAGPRPEIRRISPGPVLPDLDWGKLKAVEVRGDEGHQAAVAEAIRSAAGTPLSR